MSRRECRGREEWDNEERRDTGTRPDRRTGRSSVLGTTGSRRDCTLGPADFSCLSVSSVYQPHPSLSSQFYRSPRSVLLLLPGPGWHGNIPLHLNLFARYRRPSWTQWSSICRLSPADFSCLSLSSACLPLPPSPSLFTDRYCSCPTMGIFRCTIISLPICFGCLHPLLVWRLVTCLCVIYIYMYIYICIYICIYIFD